MSWIHRMLQAFAGHPGSKEPSTAPRRFRAINRSRDVILAEQLELAGESATRNRGLLGRDGLAPGGGLWIIPCEGVHTFGMRFAIDLVFLDKKLRVRKVRAAAAPWRISLCLTAHSVLELPVGVLALTETRKGDQLELLPVEAASAQP